MSEYARRMAYLSARIFGEMLPGTTKKNAEVLKSLYDRPMYKNNFIVDYYPPYQKIECAFEKLRLHGLYRDEHLDFKEEMERLRQLRGKFKHIRGGNKTTEKLSTK